MVTPQSSIYILKSILRYRQKKLTIVIKRVHRDKMSQKRPSSYAFASNFSLFGWKNYQHGCDPLPFPCSDDSFGVLK